MKIDHSKMKVHNFEQGSEEWHKLREGKFGSTDAQAVQANGKGLETKCYEKVGELIAGKVIDDWTNEHIERGKEHESIARSLYQIETDNWVDEVGYVELNKRVGCSPDGIVGDDGLVEIKCPSDKNFIRYVFEKKVPKKYFWQMQYQMWVTDRKWCDFVNFNKHLDKISIIRIERDEEAIEKIVEGVKAGIEKVEEILEKVKMDLK